MIITKHVIKGLGVDIDITAHVLAGVEDGPTLLLTSMLHGREWSPVLIIRELLKRLDIGTLKGNIIAIPVANALAFDPDTRRLMDNTDEPDANWPARGPNHLSGTISRVIEKEFMTHANYLIDYRASSRGRMMANTGYRANYEDMSATKASTGMALAYGFPVLRETSPFAGDGAGCGTMTPAWANSGIPAITPEIGGLSEDAPRDWIDANVAGLMGILKFLGMLDGNPSYCEKYLQVGDLWRISPMNGGYVELAMGSPSLLAGVQEGQLLARIISPRTFETIEELRSPGDGYIIHSRGNCMTHPGGCVFGIADAKTSVWMAINVPAPQAEAAVA
ncbi:MAG: succinylglutamate desuccinylase/aspartoacylase family protein [Synergistaceae bacterium]|nr:succinylglutamate desuccinylase/aspartoacylase family protein [Synergistaceae bacterium]